MSSEEKNSKFVIHIKKAKGLAAKDRNGLSDPYVKIQLNDGAEKKSKIIYKTLDPVWDEYFVFDIDATNPNVDMNKNQLRLVFYDYDFGSSDDFMGMVEINRLSFMKLDSKERWYSLCHRPNETDKQKKEEVKGRVLIRVAYLSGNQDLVLHALQSDTKNSKDTGSSTDKASTKADMHENLRKLDERGEKLNDIGKKSAELNDDAMEMKSLSKKLKESLDQKNKSFLGF